MASIPFYLPHIFCFKDLIRICEVCIVVFGLHLNIAADLY